MRLAVFDGPAPWLRPLIISEGALRGRAQTSTVMLARALTERGVGAHLLFGADGPATADARAAGVAVLDPARWSSQRSRVRGLAAVVSAGSGLYHPVHLSSVGARAARAGEAALRRRVPTVAHVRTLRDAEAALRLHRLGAHLITGSAAVLRDLVSRGAHRAEHVPDGVDVDALPQRGREAVRSWLRVGEDEVVVLLAGAWAPEDLDLLLPVALEVVGTDRRVVLVHPGGSAGPWSASGPEDRFDAAVGRAGLRSRVRRPGAGDDRGATADLVEAADLCLVPSRGADAGRAVLEAWARRRPVVSAGAGEVDDLVVDGRDGLVVDLRDASAAARVLALLSDGPRREALADAGALEVRRHHSHEAHVESVIDLYWRMAGLRGARAAPAAPRGAR